jgi:hypothetical protein
VRIPPIYRKTATEETMGTSKHNVKTFITPETSNARWLLYAPRSLTLKSSEIYPFKAKGICCNSLFMQDHLLYKMTFKFW